MDDEPNLKFRALLESAACDYCGDGMDTASMSTIWAERSEEHYKSVCCDSCGKDNWVKVCFHGSGHEHEIIDGSIESIIKRVQEG